MSFRATVLTLYPEMFPGPLGHSLAGKALERGLWSLEVSDIRAAAQDRHRTVDDSPAGGGPGMVMRADVLARAIDGATDAGERRRRLLMSPRGRKLDQALVRQLAAEPGVLIVCGHFEGVDEYVLSGGEAAALIVLDAAVRLLPGVIGTARSSEDESFEQGLLEHPHYTRPRLFEGVAIPEVLLSGDHQAIARWKRVESEMATRQRRPDLWSLRRPKDGG